MVAVMCAVCLYIHTGTFVEMHVPMDSLPPVQNNKLLMDCAVVNS